MTTPDNTPENEVKPGVLADITPEAVEATPPEPDNSTPLFPPGYLLVVSALGFLLALVHLTTQPTFGAPGWGGLAVGVLTIFVWAIMAPDQARSALTGRSAQFGGTAVITTVVFLVALVLIYTVVRGLGLSQDLSNAKTFSLTDTARGVVRTLAADPTTPKMEIIGFLNTEDSANETLIRVLLDDFQRTGNGRISYEIINPDRQPAIAQKYNAKSQQFIVVPLDDNGDPVVDKAETAAGANQQQIIDAMVKASSSGDFRVYYPRLSDAIDMTATGSDGGSVLKADLTDSYGWKVEEVSLFDANNPLVKALDPAPDGQVLLIPGGATPLPDDQLKVITDWLDKGGDLVIAAGVNPKGGESLATADNLSSYLFEHYGLRFRNDIVIDPNNLVNSPVVFVAAGFAPDQFITQDYSTSQNVLLFAQAHSIEFAPAAVQDVTVTPIVKTTAAGFTRPALDPNKELTQDDLTPTDTDMKGEIPVAAVAENTKTGSRVVLFGSDTVMQNVFRQYDSAGIKNTDASRRALFWATGYDAYRQIPSLELAQPQQVPLLANDIEVNTINVVAILLLPFGLLAFGIWQWWMRRERLATA